VHRLFSLTFAPKYNLLPLPWFHTSSQFPVTLQLEFLCLKKLVQIPSQDPCYWMIYSMDSPPLQNKNPKFISAVITWSKMHKVTKLIRQPNQKHHKQYCKSHCNFPKKLMEFACQMC
jgi:hypothetical protein